MNIDKLSREEKIALVKAIFASDTSIAHMFIGQNDTRISDEMIRRIIKDDFARYDEVFRNLA